jgi:hypothetical protein
VLVPLMRLRLVRCQRRRNNGIEQRSWRNQFRVHSREIEERFEGSRASSELGEVGVGELSIRALSVGEVRGSQNLRFESDRHAKRMEARPESAEFGHRH